MINSRPAQFVEAATLVDILRWRALQSPHQLAYTFLLHGDEEAIHYTYQELDQQARKVAAYLQQLGMQGERALLLYPSGLDYVAAFMGCLYAGVTAIPAYPPTSSRLIPRIVAIVENAQSRVILTCSAALPAIQRGFAQLPDLPDLHWVNTDTLEPALADQWQEPVLSPETLAFLQYTSGSTSTPKGVMVTHRNLLENLSIIATKIELVPSDNFVIWLPPYHDMGLIGGILTPLYGGTPVSLMAPVVFLQRPLRWLKALTRNHATVSGAPNFAYDLCVRKITEEQMATLDLSSWRLAFSGSEPVRSETLIRFAEKFYACGFRLEHFFPSYGMAETTLLVAGPQATELPTLQAFQRTALEQGKVATGLPADPGSQIVVGSGAPGAGFEVLIVNPESMTRCQEDEIGEIWVRGESVAQGYWNKPEETAKAFHAYLQDGGAGPFLRTGDLGFFYQGELYVTGRLKDIIILRGRNYYPQDLEYTVETSHTAIRGSGCAAFSIEADNQEKLVVLAEIDPRYVPARGDALSAETVASSRKLLDPQVVKSAIRQAIAEEHDLQVYQIVLLKPGGILKTSSGKHQRYACRAAFLANSLGVWDE